jgi:pimeloyl-ACP methyl ester carboxylesterase
VERRGATRLVRVACADGKTISVLTAGEGRALILLHGWGLDGIAYRAALRGLADRGFQVFAPTVNVALGRRWSLDGLARRVEAICNELGVGPCPVVGHSFGGVVGAQLALDFPTRVTSLVAVNSALVSPGGWQLTRLALPGQHYRLAADRRLIAGFLRAQRPRGTRAHLVGSVRWMLSTDMTSRLPKLAERGLPAAVLWAREACLSEALGRRAAELLGARYHAIAPDVALGHIWPLTRVTIFVERVARAIEELRTEGPAASSRRSSSP